MVNFLSLSFLIFPISFLLHMWALGIFLLGAVARTVTVLPTGGTGKGSELNYVVIVSPGANGAQSTDMSIYDFEEGGVTLTAAKHDQNTITENSDGETTQVLSPHLHNLLRTQSRVRGHYKCDYCSYTNSRQFLLKRHMRTHSTERPHVCNTCNQTFKDLVALQNHVNTHTGIKPHKCKECDASFTTSGENV